MEPRRAQVEFKVEVELIYISLQCINKKGLTINDVQEDTTVNGIGDVQ